MIFYIKIYKCNTCMWPHVHECIIIYIKKYMWPHTYI